MDYKELFLRDVPTNPDIEKRWASRPKSKLVKYLMLESQTPREDIEKRLNTNHQYFDNKLFRNSWSFEDILAVADECGYEFCLDKRLFIEIAKSNTANDVNTYNDGRRDGYEQARKDVLKALDKCFKEVEEDEVHS